MYWAKIALLTVFFGNQPVFGVPYVRDGLYSRGDYKLAVREASLSRPSQPGGAEKQLLNIKDDGTTQPTFGSPAGKSPAFSIKRRPVGSTERIDPNAKASPVKKESTAQGRHSNSAAKPSLMVKTDSIPWPNFGSPVSHETPINSNRQSPETFIEIQNVPSRQSVRIEHGYKKKEGNGNTK